MAKRKQFKVDQAKIDAESTDESVYMNVGPYGTYLPGFAAGGPLRQRSTYAMFKNGKYVGPKEAPSEDKLKTPVKTPQPVSSEYFEISMQAPTTSVRKPVAQDTESAETQTATEAESETATADEVSTTTARSSTSDTKSVRASPSDRSQYALPVEIKQSTYLIPKFGNQEIIQGATPLIRLLAQKHAQAAALKKSHYAMAIPKERVAAVLKTGPPRQQQQPIKIESRDVARVASATVVSAATSPAQSPSVHSPALSPINTKQNSLASAINAIKSRNAAAAAAATPVAVAPSPQQAKQKTPTAASPSTQ